MSLPPMFPTKSTAGIITKPSSGERVVAGSRRPDGSLRKELKIRPGYTPEEDIKRFRSTRMAEQDARAATKGVVPGAKTTTTTKQPAVAMSKAQKKNFKRKEKRRGEEEVGGEESGEEGERKGKEEEEEVPESWDDGDEEEVPAAPAAVPEPEPVVVATAPVDDEKRLKALRKKLRQAEQLRERDESTFSEAEKVKVEGIAGLEEEIAKLSLSSAPGEQES